MVRVRVRVRVKVRVRVRVRVSTLNIPTVMRVADLAVFWSSRCAFGDVWKSSAAMSAAVSSS